MGNNASAVTTRCRPVAAALRGEVAGVSNFWRSLPSGGFGSVRFGAEWKPKRLVSAFHASGRVCLPTSRFLYL